MYFGVGVDFAISPLSFSLHCQCSCVPGSGQSRAMGGFLRGGAVIVSPKCPAVGQEDPEPWLCECDTQHSRAL